MLTNSQNQSGPFTWLPIQRLLDPTAFSHSTKGIELMETHISWVLLTGEYAYKIKKPVDFGFVDYSTLEKRKHFCELEVKLNRRFAKELYLGVVPIVSHNGNVKVVEESELQQHAGAVIEYAVKMRQFPQDAIVAARLQNPGLTSNSVEAFGSYLAGFHETIDSATPTIQCVQPGQIIADALDNFAVVREILTDEPRLAMLERLEHWTARQADRLASKFRERLLNGSVRRCHGDLHLKNIVQLNGDLTAFDGIEFNEKYQWIDVLSEIAFPVMDFVVRGRPDLGWRLLNAWLEETGDYHDLDVLRFYLVYRAMVRAKVTCLNPKNKDPETRNRYSTGLATPDPFTGPWDKYLTAAEYFAFELRPWLSITHGFSGSGKSTAAMQVIEHDGGIRIRSDVERHRLAKDLMVRDEYSANMSDRVYTCLLETATSVLDAGFPVVVDATFLSQKRRLAFSSLARQKSTGFEILDCHASCDILRDRIRNRGSDPSDATIEVLNMQMKSHDPLTTDELTFVRKAPAR